MKELENPVKAGVQLIIEYINAINGFVKSQDKVNQEFEERLKKLEQK